MEMLRLALSAESTENETAATISESFQANIAAGAAKFRETLEKAEQKASSKDVEAVIQLASNLALDMASQRCRVQLFNFEDEEAHADRSIRWLKDCNPTNKPKNIDGTVLLSVSPGLQRIGDESGGSLDMCTFIHPVGVFLQKE